MKVREVLQNPQQLIGHQLTIEGGLVIQFDRGYICPDLEEFRNENESIFIRNYQRLASRFRYIVSSLVGSNVRYLYWASITGTLSQSSLEPFAVDLINITDVILTDEREKTESHQHYLWLFKRPSTRLKTISDGINLYRRW